MGDLNTLPDCDNGGTPLTISAPIGPVRCIKRCIYWTAQKFFFAICIHGSSFTVVMLDYVHQADSALYFFDALTRVARHKLALESPTLFPPFLWHSLICSCQTLAIGASIYERLYSSASRHNA